MSYKTQVPASITGLKGIDGRIQTIAVHMPNGVTGGLTWLTYAYGLSDRIVEFREGKEFIYPAVFQDINSRDYHSCMPNDLPAAFSFWTKEDAKINDPARGYYNISCIFFMDLRQIAPTNNFKLTKSKIRQDILEWVRVHKYMGVGVWDLVKITDDDITQVYKGFSVNQLDNIVRQLPKYAIRLDFTFSFILECPVTNSYS
jgi:hypothetical protein